MTVAIVALVVVNLPVTHFRRPPASPPVTPLGAGGWVRRAARNALGVLLIVIGALLSLPGIPGQGVLTMLVGVMLVDFPGRRRLETALVRRPGVLAGLNRVRAWFGRPPLAPPE